jgi:ATP-dependent helicase HrpA
MCTTSCTRCARARLEGEPDQPASYEAIHKALLTGLLGHVGLKIEEEPALPRRPRHQVLHPPGLALVKKAGRWIVAAELVETSRLFARCVARIEPEWLEEVGVSTCPAPRL